MHTTIYNQVLHATVWLRGAYTLFLCHIELTSSARCPEDYRFPNTMETSRIPATPTRVLATSAPYEPQ
jgi:hypothetical protein